MMNDSRGLRFFSVYASVLLPLLYLLSSLYTAISSCLPDTASYAASAVLFSASVAFALLGIIRLLALKTEPAAVLLLLSSAFSLASSVIYEISICSIRAYSSIGGALPEIMVLSSGLAVILSFISRMRKGWRRSFWTVLSAASIAAVSSSAVIYAHSFAYIYISAGSSGAYRILSAISPILLAVASICVLCSRRGSIPSYPCILVALSAVSAVLSGFMEYDDGCFLRAILDGGFSILSYQSIFGCAVSILPASASVYSALLSMLLLRAVQCTENKAMN